MEFDIRVYKIYWSTNDETYIGSTRQSLSRRMTGHRSKCRHNQKMTSIPLFKAIKNYGYDFSYIELETKRVKERTEQLKLETEWIQRLKPSLNRQNPHRTREEALRYYKTYNKHRTEEQKTNQRELRKKWETQNKKQRKIYKQDLARKHLHEETYKCITCYKVFTRAYSLSRHKNTHIHCKGI